MSRNFHGVEWPRRAVVQYTNCELRGVLRHGNGLALMQPSAAKAYRMMAYGVLVERRMKSQDRNIARDSPCA